MSKCFFTPEGRRVLRVAARVLVEAGAVLEEDVEEVLGGDQLLEEEADRLLDRKCLPPLGREDDSVLGLDSVDAFLHGTLVRRESLRAEDSPGFIGG